MKSKLILALLSGAIISAGLLIADTFTESNLFVMDLMWPGINAAYLFWGTMSGSPVMGIIVAWLVNAIVYGLPVFVVLITYRLIAQALRSKKAA